MAPDAGRTAEARPTDTTPESGLAAEDGRPTERGPDARTPAEQGDTLDPDAGSERPGPGPQFDRQDESAGVLEPLSAEQPGPEEAGSSRSVAAAVQHALAARARAAQPNGVVDPRRGDARDRLLAVLLDDPVRAVGATVELQNQQEELSRLAEEMRNRRDELGSVVRRLAAAGLGPDQVAKLAGLDRAEVDRMLNTRRP
ncbi:hypothetical protein LWC33_29065 [Pseudonocardia sp. RS11V-5]|uniref:hypothetical protein n=1 Tax=Pseudonocardia terrae TaxID=2905831 RepID=UPI001E2C484B|nr:hypothetical protein [Pseudonocardia terrae]MCE3555485.1 hypothetical protein [Pseudonocardia terrae]